MNDIPPLRFEKVRLTACWLLAALWMALTAWASASPSTPAGIAAAGGQFLALLAFILIHASLALGWRGTIAFVSVVWLTSFLIEALSVRTGFPFGYFEHHAPGPRPLDIPLVVPLGYAVFGWLAWSQTRSLLHSLNGMSARTFLSAAPLVGAFILAGYDYPWDPIGAAVLHTHSYREPSGLFGVPLLNFVGWLVTGWVAFQLFALIERRRFSGGFRPAAAYELLPPLIWIGMAASYLLRFWSAPEGNVEVAGRHFVISDILEASAAIGLPAMVMPALIVVVAIAARSRADVKGA